jgi:hypothetical protein
MVAFSLIPMAVFIQAFSMLKNMRTASLDLYGQNKSLVKKGHSSELCRFELYGLLALLTGTQ